MKKILIALFLSLAIISCTKKADNSSILYNSAVYVELDQMLPPDTVEKMVSVGHGTGIVIKHLGSDYWILTAEHIVAAADKMTAKGNETKVFIRLDPYNKKEYLADVTKRDADKDLAVIHINTASDDLQREISSVCSVAPKELDEVISTGFPGAYSEVISRGMMVIPAYAIPDPDNPNFLLPEALHTTLTGPGYSGGGLYEQQEGQYCLIGINSMGSNAYPQISFAVSYWAIKDFLKGVI